MRKFILITGMVAALSGCVSNGYYPGTYRTYGGGNSWPTGNSTGGSSTASTNTSGDGTPAGYHYGDPKFCSPDTGFCPLLIGAAIVGLAAALAH